MYDCQDNVSLSVKKEKVPLSMQWWNINIEFNMKSLYSKNAFYGFSGKFVILNRVAV